MDTSPDPLVSSQILWSHRKLNPLHEVFHGITESMEEEEGPMDVMITAEQSTLN